MNRKRFFAVTFALLVALSIGAAQLAAQTQTTGDVAGVVSDPSNAVVPDARVSLKDNTKGSTQEGKTNKDGAYRFYLLPPGSYTITVAASGFQNTAREVDVAVGQIANVNLQLTLGTSTQTVTVTEAAPLVQTENGNAAVTLSESQVANVPNPGGDLSYIAQLAPGSVMNTGMGQGNFSSYGMSATANLFTLNGMDNNDPFLNLNNSGATNLTLGSNEVQEASVVSGGYSGEYGTLAGASVNYITKSGGNDFHGNGIYYWNGRAMNANNWFNKAAGDGRSFDNVNQWAGSFGGPIKKDKLFFYMNTEGLRVILPTSVNAKIPTAAYENYVLGNLPLAGMAASVPFFQQAFTLYNNANGAANATSASLKNGGCGGLTGTADPAGGTFGTADPCAAQFTASNPNFTHEWQIAGRVDYNIGSNDKAFVRIGHDHGLQATITSVISPLFNVISDQPQWEGQFMETHTFGPSLVNQFILSGAWYAAAFSESNRAAALAAFPTTLSWRDGSFFSMGQDLDNIPQGRKVTQYQISDDVSKTWGNHTIRAGMKFRRNDVTDLDYGILTAGLDGVTITTAPVGQTSFLEQSFPSNPGNPTAPGVLEQPIALYSLALYGEDDWRVRSNLTLTLSLRAEHFSNPVCQTNCFARLTGAFADVSHDPNQPYNTAINTGLNQALQGLQSLAWAPRFGFAWQPFGTARNFVLRGGIGIFYDQFPGQVVDNFSENSPLYNIFVVGGAASPAEKTSAFTNAAQSNQAFLGVFNSGGTVGDLENAGFQPPNIFTANKQTKVPQYQKWSLEIQKGFGSNTTVQVGYHGNHGIHELIIDPSLNAFCDNPADPASVCSKFVSNLPSAPPDPRFGTVSFADTHSVSNYNGVTLSFNRRITGWGSGVFSANYTYSHSFDEISNGGELSFVQSTNTSLLTPQIPGDYRNNYGPSDYDVRHYLNANYVWQLPIRKALAGRGWAPLVDGWQVSGAIFARSGLPYTVVDPVTSGNLSLLGYGGTVYSQFLGGSIPSCGRGAALANIGVGGSPCLTADLFAPSDPNSGNAPGFGGNGLRNKFRGPGYTDTDFTISKSTKIPRWERGELAIGFQFFNLFNHPNFDQPVSNITDSQFGQITTAVSSPTSIVGSFLGGDASPRLIQFKAELKF